MKIEILEFMLGKPFLKMKDFMDEGYTRTDIEELVTARYIEASHQHKDGGRRSYNLTSFGLLRMDPF